MTDRRNRVTAGAAQKGRMKDVQSIVDEIMSDCDLDTATVELALRLPEITRRAADMLLSEMFPGSNGARVLDLWSPASRGGGSVGLDVRDARAAELISRGHRDGVVRAQLEVEGHRGPCPATLRRLRFELAAAPETTIDLHGLTNQELKRVGAFVAAIRMTRR